MNSYTSPLTLEALESHLAYAEQELAKSTTKRIQAADTENQWLMEVQSVKNLITVRRNRASGTASQALPAVQPANGSAEGGNAEGVPETSHIDWIAKVVVASGNRGMTPPEILRDAEKAGITMHRNYPYVALKALVKRDRVIKREGRYYHPANTG
jgi:hypothetical protein